MSELLMLGCVATQSPGEALCNGPAAGQITNRAEANQKVAWKYRDGWKMRGPAPGP